MDKQMIQVWLTNPVNKAIIKKLVEGKKELIEVLLETRPDTELGTYNRLIGSINAFSTLLDLETLLEDVEIQE